MCSFSLVPKDGRVRPLNPLLKGFCPSILAMIVTLTIAMTIALKVFAGCLPFLLLLPFQRANRELIVNALTGAHLSIVSRNADSFKYPA